MVSLKSNPTFDFPQHWQGSLSDYVTAIAWSPSGQQLAASSAAGELMLLNLNNLRPAVLQSSTGQSVDCVAFSANGQFLATGGQSGQVSVWRVQSDPATLDITLDNRSSWVDRIAWHPKLNQFAFNLGFYVQIWDAEESAVVETLDLNQATAQNIQWHPSGDYLAIAVKNSIRVWDTNTWERTHFLEMASPSRAIAWSQDGKYLASGNLDRTLLVWQWGNEFPWQMRGFPGKVRHLTWSGKPTKSGFPLIIASSAEGIVSWEKDADETVGWNPHVMELHNGTVEAIALQPNSLLLASAAADGWVCLWQNAKTAALILEGAANGFSCLAWHPKGHQLAAGGQAGEVFIWNQAIRGQGFGKR